MAGIGGPEGNSHRANQYRIKRTLERLLDEASSKHEGMTALEAACRAQIEKAEGGDLASFKEVADRTEGKPAQSLDLGSDPDRPVVQKIVREIVRPPNPDG
jgi:hypothetical protein